MTVLILARIKDNWKDLVNWLEAMDAELIYVNSCKQGLRMLDEHREVDLILVESKEPEDCGMKLLHSVKKDHRLQTLPVIMVGTAFSDDAVREFLAQDVDDIIILPIPRKTFEVKVRTAENNGKKKILIVDDQPFILDLLEQFLKMERYQPLRAETAEDALEILKRQTVDAVVTDIVLPGMAGTELLATIKEKYPGIAVILITGHSGRYRPEDAISMGADGFFAKPFNNIELIYTLRRVLGHYYPRRSRKMINAGTSTTS